MKLIINNLSKVSTSMALWAVDRFHLIEGDTDVVKIFQTFAVHARKNKRSITYTITDLESRKGEA